MRENSFIGPRRSIRAAAILVVLAIASLGPTLLAVQNAAGGDSPATDRAIASGARNGWEARPDSMLSRQWGPRQFGRDYLDDRIHDVSHRLAEIERAPDFAPIFKAVDPGSSTAAAFPLSFQIMGLISIALSLGGLVVVARNRPALEGLRGTNETREARRNLVRCVVLLLAVNLADLAFTVFLSPVREFVELNPLADLLRDCLPALIAAKLLLAGACAVSLLAFWRYKIAQLASWGAAATYVGLAMWWVAYFNAARS
jgi:hypothetical protein